MTLLTYLFLKVDLIREILWFVTFISFPGWVIYNLIASGFSERAVITRRRRETEPDEPKWKSLPETYSEMAAKARSTARKMMIALVLSGSVAILMPSRNQLAVIFSVDQIVNLANNGEVRKTATLASKVIRKAMTDYLSEDKKKETGK